MSDQKKYSLEFTISFSAPEPYVGLLKSGELARAVENTCRIQCKNTSKGSFPGIGLDVVFKEYGPAMSTSYLAWTMTDSTMEVPNLNPEASWETEMPFTPTMDGLCLAEITLQSRGDESVPPSDIDLSGGGSESRSKLTNYFYVVPREALDLQIALNNLSSKLERTSDG